MRLVVVGAGIFGVTAARELARRGHRVTLLEAGRAPDPAAASTDISKVCRMEYGGDVGYMRAMERARAGWLAWNEGWRARGADELYHECGVVMVRRSALQAGDFERESFRLLEERGHAPERLDADAIARRFPAWKPGAYVDGFFHAHGGWAESGRVVETLLGELGELGVEVRESTAVSGLRLEGGRVRGVRTALGEEEPADAVVLTAGSWTHELLGELDGPLRATGHAIFHLRPAEPELFRAERFPVFTADIARTGFYGFPLHPGHGVVKIALHDEGLRLRGERPTDVTAEQRAKLATFLEETFPSLVDAEVVSTRLCPYSDTQDQHFWIARHPEHDNVTVAAGGSGHGFKFAPVLGEWTADAVEGVANEELERFRWRHDLRLDRGLEEARLQGE